MIVVASGHFNDAAFGCKIAFQNDQATSWFQRCVDFSDDFLVGGFFCGGRFFRNGATSHSNSVAAKEFRIKQPFSAKSSASSSVQISGNETSAWLEIGDDGDFRADAVEIVDA